MEWEQARQHTEPYKHEWEPELGDCRTKYAECIEGTGFAVDLGCGRAVLSILRCRDHRNLPPARGRFQMCEIETVSWFVRVIKHLAEFSQPFWVGIICEETPGTEVHHQHTDQCHHRADKDVQRELHGGVFAPFDPAPCCDQQVHREDRKLIPKKQ